MVARTIKMLHIEDDAVQQRLAAKQLETLPEFQFRITCVDSEDAAVAEFDKGGHELVLLDYHLSQGNGLSCLRKLRHKDRIVPIVALSGMATPEIAAELLRVGADDYLSKQDLSSDALAKSVRDALARADAWRRHAPSEVAPETVALFRDLCQTFAAALGAEFVKRLDAFEAAARHADVSAARMQLFFEDTCADLEPTENDLRLRLRPLLLEMLLRLFGPDKDRTP